MPGAVAGFYGKLPARGDFIRVGLPRDFTDRWDAWLQEVLSGSRALMGDDWLPAYLEAPVWRFALPPAVCGTQAALGVMLPSVDRAGRLFPLTFAALRSTGIQPESGHGWLDHCETLGRQALEQDTPPQEIAAMLTSPELADASPGGVDSMWWSDGSDRVKPMQITLHSLPDVTTYAAMLGANATESTA